MVTKLPNPTLTLGDCASKKAASANVETVFSGAKKLADSASTMDDDLLGAYVINHINWQYEWLRPTVHDIVCQYVAMHGADDDVSSDDEPAVGNDSQLELEAASPPSLDHAMSPLAHAM